MNTKNDDGKAYEFTVAFLDTGRSGGDVVFADGFQSTRHGSGVFIPYGGLKSMTVEKLICFSILLTFPASVRHGYRFFKRMLF
ncbi:MAG: hypothetical protein LBR53_05585 [Deltaproteobacteria bacterium]|jgi:hypothetical protein|nr:hypothetical protein [Deltaproteobacteria bacterium]